MSLYFLTVHKKRAEKGLVLMTLFILSVNVRKIHQVDWKPKSIESIAGYAGVDLTNRPQLIKLINRIH